MNKLIELVILLTLGFTLGLSILGLGVLALFKGAPIIGGLNIIVGFFLVCVTARLRNFD